MRYLLPLLFTPFFSLAQVQKGDSIRISPGKPLDGIEVDYFRQDEWMGIQKGHIVTMPGRTFEVVKVKNGKAYIKDATVKMNDWTFGKYRLNIPVLLSNKSIEVIKQK